MECSELTYYLLEPGYPDSVVFYFLILKFMLVELILAVCSKCVRPTFSSCRVLQWLRLSFYRAACNVDAVYQYFHAAQTAR